MYNKLFILEETGENVEIYLQIWTKSLHSLMIEQNQLWPYLYMSNDIPSQTVLPFHVFRQNKLHPSKGPSQPLPDGDSVSTLCQLSHQDHILIRASLPEVDWVSTGRQSRVLRQLGCGLHGSPCGLTVHSDFTVRLTNGGKVNRRNHFGWNTVWKSLFI